jgi:hypothetical protein
MLAQTATTLTAKTASPSALVITSGPRSRIWFPLIWGRARSSGGLGHIPLCGNDGYCAGAALTPRPLRPQTTGQPAPWHAGMGLSHDGRRGVC